ncbi:MAG: tRNA (5-methylaminomethyl-2-thiouridine)(34)-methyltransferase MnmD [Bacteroidetes bacterium]|nr:tRNA (5-methylaminomethyl-2-thiouridine)(34)-methyltransferase MnmD [Bacteroidota bacterium]
MELYLTADGSPTLLTADGVAYHSRQGAEAESRYVYLQASQLAERLAAATSLHLLEIGLGTGLNFVLTARLAAQYPQAQLHYTAYEPQPVPVELLGRYYAHMPHLQGEWTAILQAGAPQGQQGNVHWDFRHQPWPDAGYRQPADIIFYDAFGPKDAPALWTNEVLTYTLGVLAPGGTLVTFSINGATKRLLKQLGYPFVRPRGFGHKREMLVVQARQD